MEDRLNSGPHDVSKYLEVFKNLDLIHSNLEALAELDKLGFKVEPDIFMKHKEQSDYDISTVLSSIGISIAITALAICVAICLYVKFLSNLK